MPEFTLSRTVQCKTCPWKKDADPYQIPDYVPDKHEKLDCTIADETDPIAHYYQTLKEGTVKVMSCHYDHEDYCIGWLNNQLNEGNNIALRMKMMNCTNAHKIKVIGEQHENFKDTLPK